MCYKICYCGFGMYESERKNILVEEQRPLVVRALRRSIVRKKIVRYLFDISPSYSYTSEIAYHVNTTPTNVIGALRGMKSSYRQNESLIGLNLIEEKNVSSNIKLYGLTPYGKEILGSILEKEK